MSYWDDAVKDIAHFNSAYAQVERKPQDTAILKKCVTVASKLTMLFVWANKALTEDSYEELLTLWRETRKLAKEREPLREELLSAIHRFRTATQKAIASTAPEEFSYHGFKISNKEHFAEALCRKTLEGVDVLNAFFRKRGVERVLQEGIARIILTQDAGRASAFFHSGTRELTLSVSELSKAKPGRFIDSFTGEAVLHEFGHFVHRNYITGEAREAWDSPWDSMVNDPKRQEKLDSLEIVTDYGKTDKYEDFAETFLLFMVAPEKLSPTAKFRMQRALSLSGLYGKPVLHLSSKDLDVVFRVATRFTRQG